MNGPDHYREAEKLLAEASNADAEAAPADVAMVLQFAQVHATLALAAATAWPIVSTYIGDEVSEPREWAQATK